MQHLICRTLAVLAALIGTSAIAVAAAQSNQPPERFTAFAVSLAEGTSGASVVDIDIRRWSSDAERTKLLQTLKENGPDALLDAFQDMEPVGTIRTPDSLGYSLRYAHQMPAEDGGRDIIIATDRPISFWEAANQTRTMRYPFSVIQLHMPKEGTGEGKLSVATRITESRGTIFLENYNALPVQLREVRSNR